MWREARVTKIVKFLFYFSKQTFQVSKTWNVCFEK
jgi:hypothetical protein